MNNRKKYILIITVIKQRKKIFLKNKRYRTIETIFFDNNCYQIT